jgi:hypothetical protein
VLEPVYLWIKKHVAQASFVIGAAPSGSIDLTVRKNGSGASYVDGPITVASGSTIDLQWTGTNVTAGTCVASGNWNGAKANPTSSQLAVSTPANPSTYTLTCNTTAGSKDDSVTVNILNAPVINVTSSAGCIAPASTDTALITWSQVANANSYEIYDNAVFVSSAATCAAGTCSYNHSGLVAGSSHLYTVRSVNGSERVTSNSFLRTISNMCQPDLIPSMPTTASPLTVGSNITFNSTITNQGNYTTGAGFANSFGVYDSSGITLLATLTSSPVSGALGASASAGIISGTWNPSSVGTYVIKVTADSGSSIAESAEGNNVAQASFVIGAAPTSFTRASRYRLSAFKINAPPKLCVAWPNRLFCVDSKPTPRSFPTCPKKWR